MTDSALQQFANLLREEKDEVKRAQLHARANMLAMQELPDEAFEPPVTPLGEYLDSPIEIPPSIVWPTMVVRGEITATLSRAGKGKTTMNLNRLMRWAAGLPMFDNYTDKEGNAYLAPPEPVRALIVENEGSAGMFHHKVGVMLNGPGRFTAEQKKMVRENLLIYGDGGYSGLKLDNEAHESKIRAACEKWSPDIMLIEPFRSLHKGEENSSTDIANVLDILVAISTDYRLGTILSHHARKGSTDEDDLMSMARGSTALEGVVCSMENFQAVKGGDFKEITWSKSRYLQPPPPTRMQYTLADGWFDFIPLERIEQDILEALLANGDEAMTKKDLAEDLNEKADKLTRPLAQLVEDGKLKRIASMSTGNGSSGHRYILSNSDDGEGLAI
jgi:hypothetical protein